MIEREEAQRFVGKKVSIIIGIVQLDDRVVLRVTKDRLSCKFQSEPTECHELKDINNIYEQE